VDVEGLEGLHRKSLIIFLVLICKIAGLVTPMRKELLTKGCQCARLDYAGWYCKVEGKWGFETASS
jgi:hypothetical protein